MIIYLKNWGNRLKNVFKLWKFLKFKDFVCLFANWLKNALFFPKIGLENFDNKKKNLILKWLTERYDYLIPEIFEKSVTDNEIDKGKEPIWVLWYQGENNMPEIVRLCYKSICLNSNGHSVNLLTQDNITDYVNIPEHVWKLVESGAMTYTHFSDILRIYLLYEYGGLWIDSTVFVTAPIETNKFGSLFYSIKNIPLKKGTISDYRWTSFFLYAQKGSPAFNVFRNLFHIYTEENNNMIDYFLIDYFFDLLYQKNKIFKQEVDVIPYTNAKLHMLVRELDNPYDRANYEKYIWETSVFKFSYRPKFVKINKQTNKQTLYGHLTKIYLG